jgi:hypothetical protein
MAPFLKNNKLKFSFSSFPKTKFSTRSFDFPIFDWTKGESEKWEKRNRTKEIKKEHSFEMQTFIKRSFTNCCGD